jgi:hypothetical protein
MHCIVIANEVSLQAVATGFRTDLVITVKCIPSTALKHSMDVRLMTQMWDGNKMFPRGIPVVPSQADQQEIHLNKSRSIQYARGLKMQQCSRWPKFHIALTIAAVSTSETSVNFYKATRKISLNNSIYMQKKMPSSALRGKVRINTSSTVLLFYRCLKTNSETVNKDIPPKLIIWEPLCQ